MIVVDTGFWLALADRRDTHHEAAKRALKKVDEPLITTWCVVTETSYLLLSRKGVPAQVAFINSLCDGAFGDFTKIYWMARGDPEISRVLAC
ncbi:PIN domain-containing protein [Lyngbya sp. CCY1209]|uniref:type II toxin-antitoxin system VapC family toxin n=1 Tax=Lyngbya sp. CCY1209 TaxID=2886103 RepID=UPI002D210FE5|nr:PIN domain-containing protein [Lyngbya sp. CCY1209]MEB3884284.1 PIN domain-containing protein [Lyngbya sp. CCY1209]